LFGGANLQLDEGYQLVFQNLIYSSVFPDDENSDIGWLIDELTIGARFFLSPQAILELAMVENLSQGPHNIDIVFLSTIGMVF
ncbi:MAG: hypothetical protein GY786_10410, partial [Proteobacteria bacterium]|nr:hypothetical protein [Pseudomonadota bacterium]